MRRTQKEVVKGIKIDNENQQLKKDIERLNKQIEFLYKGYRTVVQRIRDAQELDNLKQQLKQIKEGSLIPEIYIDDLNELSRLRKKIDEEWINKIKKHGLYCSKKGDIGIDLDDMIKQEESIRGDERNKIRKKIEDRIKELEKEKKIVEEIINNQKCYDCKLLQDTLGEECCNKHKDRLLEISCKIKELKSLLEVDK